MPDSTLLVRPPKGRAEHARWRQGARDDRQRPAEVYLARVAPGGARNQRSLLNRMARFMSSNQQDALSFPWHEVTYADVAALRERLIASGVTFRTTNNYLKALRSVLRECKRLRLMTADAFEEATDVAPVKGESLPAGRHVTADEVDQLFAFLDTLEGAAALRDRAAFAILRATGIRRAELCGATLDSYDPTNATLKVLGKGSKRRELFLPEWCIGYVEEWLDWRGRSPGALICVCDRYCNVYPSRHLDLKSFWRNFADRVAQSGILYCTPHDFRRTWVGDQLEAGHDLVKVQRAAGHASPAQTARYDRRGLASRRSLADSIARPNGGANDQA
jgi:integrase/recombinase XerD